MAHSDTYKEIAQRLGSAATHERSVDKPNGSEAVEAYGVKGMKSTPWRKVFKSVEAMQKWVEANDAEIHGTRPSNGSFSRPGAKAKMGELSGLTDATLKGEATRLLRLWHHTKSGESGLQPSTVRYRILELVEEMQSRNMADPKLYAILKTTSFSRPGAKAKFAVKVGDRVHAGVGTAGGAGVIGTVTKIEDGYAHIQADASASDRYGAKTYKAPLRLVTAAPKKAWESSKNAVREGEKVSASDDAVSRKIRKLMDEGKPQKQAVAIALDLERRGEL